MPGFITRLVDKTKTLKLKQRMLLVYILGCLLPSVFVYIYMYNQTQQTIIEQTADTDKEKLENSTRSINNSMSLIEELSTGFFYDTVQRQLGLRLYSGDESIKAGYKEFDKLMDYIRYYCSDVDDVCVYLYEGDFDNRHINYITDYISELDWFKKTMENKGFPYWSYMTDVYTGKRRLRLTRPLYDEDKNRVGVVRISVKSEVTDELTKNSEVPALLVYEDMTIISSNVNISDNDLPDVMEAVLDDDFDGWVFYKGTNYLTTLKTIHPRYSKEKYYALTMNSYQSVVSKSEEIASRTMLPFLVGVLIGALSILMFANWLSKRIESFSGVMHKAAQGDFECRNESIGNVQDEIWELNNDLNRMILDIEHLMDTAIKERVQKERLYSRQKDVEFKMLATQINPHFLYNTLENIRMLARINKQPEIEDISVTLTKLLRRSLRVGDSLETLLWEMEMVEYYVRIQNYRFGERIKTYVIYDKETASEYMVLPLVIQPFVENAYVHAMEDKEEGGIITVRVEIGDLLKIYIEDNGHGMSSDQLAEMTRYINDFDNLDRTHIGVCNVNQRIKLRFGNSFGVDFDSVENVGTNVNITLPLVPKI